MKKSEIKATPNMTLGEIQYICGRYYGGKCEDCPAKKICSMLTNDDPWQWDLGNGHRISKGEDI